MGVSQHRLGRRYGVNQSAISRNLKKLTSIRVYKRRSAPKYISEDQQKQAKSDCLKLYKKISPNCQLILDDEKYFTFSGNVPRNNRYYSSDTSSAPENIKFIQKQKFEPHLLVWLAISPRGISNPYIHRSKTATREAIYLKQCIRGHLLPFIKNHHQNDDILFWPDLASSHYAYWVLRCLESNNLPYVRRNQNPPNVPQCQAIEKIWALIEQMVYPGGWEAKNLDQLANRIKSKIKQLDQTVVTTMVQGVRRKILKMYWKSVYSTCWTFFYYPFFMLFPIKTEVES